MPSPRLRIGQLIAKEILGEKIVFGRSREGKPFALRDNCPHRSVPLSAGSFDGETLQCCYHGWQFNCAGECKNIPAIAPGSNIEVSQIRVFRYPVAEVNDMLWIYFSDKTTGHYVEPLTTGPSLPVPITGKFRHVETVVLPTNIDHSVIGLIDPAHVTFVHQSWFWRSAKKQKLKTKEFVPTSLGFKMVRHQPSTNSKGYSILKGGTSTEITFEIPGNRFEHIRVGDRHEIVSVTMLTPRNDHETELNHVVYSSLPLMNWFWWPLKYLGRQFIGQDLGVFFKLSEGLKSDPPLMLVGEPDTQARWYYEIKRLWLKAQQDNVPFVNSIQPATLHWVT